jgi:hypothetical protein
MVLCAALLHPFFKPTGLVSLSERKEEVKIKIKKNTEQTKANRGQSKKKKKGPK